MFCPECGKPLLEKSAICPSCGSALPELPAAEEALPAEEMPKPSPLQASDSSAEVAVPSSGEASAGSSLTAGSPVPSPMGSASGDSRVAQDNSPPSHAPPPPVIISAPVPGTSYSTGPAVNAGLSAPPVQPAGPAGALPADVASIKLFFIISAIANFLGMGFWGLMSLVFMVVYFLGCLFVPLALITLAALVMDVMAIMKLNGPPGEDVYKSLRISCYLDCAAFCALVPTIMGILNLMNLGKPEVKSYFNVH